MGLMFCPEVKNEDELLHLLKEGKFDKSIFEYLVEVMLERESKILEYDPVEIFEMQALLLEDNELLNFQFSNIDESGIYEKNRFVINEKQREIFKLFGDRIREIYAILQRLV